MRYELPDGRVLLDDVAFRVGDGAKVALVGANGAGKTTLLRIITGDLAPHAGAVTRSGGLGVMRQMVAAGSTTVAELLLSVAPTRVRTAAAEIDRLELLLMESDDEPTQLAYAEPWPSSPMRAATRSRSSGTPAAPRRSGSPTRRRSTATWPPSAGASRSGSCWSTCSPGPTRCCCSTSRTTSSTCRARCGSRDASAPRPRPSCSSATTASCSPTPRPGSSPSSSAPRGTPCGPIRAGSRRTTRRVATGSRASRSSPGAGTRSTRSCAPRC